MALNSAEFPFLLPALAVPWQNCCQMSVPMVQMRPEIAGSSSFSKYGKPAGMQNQEVHQGHSGQARGTWVYHRCCSVYRACGGRSAMKPLMPFVVALLSLTGAALRAQNISASTQLKFPAGRRVLALAGREISGEQLEQMLAGSNREPDVKVAKQLSELELTERLSAAGLARCEANLRGPDARRALVALADRASFLAPPIYEICPIAEPDPQAQRRMIALSEDYVKKVLHQLPNLYATRVTISFQHNKKPLHWVSTESAIVRYLDGQEERPRVRTVPVRDGSGAGGMTTAGEFGPILYVALVDSAQGNLTWSHWEQGAAAPEAVYRYAVIGGKSHYH